MNKNLCTAVLICVLLSIMVFPVCAAEDSAIAVFGLDDKLYVFLEAEGEEKIQLSFEGMPVQEGVRKTSEPFVDSGQRVHYFLLLDRSTSMEKYKEQVKEFVAGLLEDTQVKKLITLLSFGDAFETEMENAVDEDAVLKKLQEISCDERKTNLYKGIESALDYVESQIRSNGDLYQIILITDGVLYDASDEPTPEKVEEKLREAKDVVFMTLGIGVEADFQDFFAGDGIWYLSIDGDASHAASEMAQKVNCLYVVCFDIDEQFLDSTLDIVLFFPESKKKWKINGVFVGRRRAEEHEGVISTGIPQGLKEKLEDKWPGADGKTEDEMGQEDIIQDIGDSGVGHAWTKQLLLYGMFLLGGIVLGCSLMLFWKKNQKKMKREGEPERVGGQQGILLHIEVISGHCLTKKRSFTLERDIVIGHDSKCELVWDDADVSDRNSRIFMRSDTACIEDLNSVYGTAINGMRIYTPNRLRDGDVISIGRIQFRVLLP